MHNIVILPFQRCPATKVLPEALVPKSQSWTDRTRRNGYAVYLGLVIVDMDNSRHSETGDRVRVPSDGSTWRTKHNIASCEVLLTDSYAKLPDITPHSAGKHFKAIMFRVMERICTHLLTRVVLDSSVSNTGPIEMLYQDEGHGSCETFSVDIDREAECPRSIIFGSKGAGLAAFLEDFVCCSLDAIVFVRFV